MPAPSTPKRHDAERQRERLVAFSRLARQWHYRSSAAMLQICVQLSKTHVVSFPDSE